MRDAGDDGRERGRKRVGRGPQHEGEDARPRDLVHERREAREAEHARRQPARRAGRGFAATFRSVRVRATRCAFRARSGDRPPDTGDPDELDWRPARSRRGHEPDRPRRAGTGHADEGGPRDPDARDQDEAGEQRADGGAGRVQRVERHRSARAGAGRFAGEPADRHREGGAEGRGRHEHDQPGRTRDGQREEQAAPVGPIGPREQRRQRRSSQGSASAAAATPSSSPT